SINFDKEAKLDEIARAYGVDYSELNEIYDKVAREMNIGNDSVLITQGANVAPIVAAVSDTGQRKWSRIEAFLIGVGECVNTPQQLECVTTAANTGDMYWLAMHRYVMNIPHQITACPDR
ncbi:hypothetical protein V9P81_26220, partial [Enterobacter hormaechei subsp. hoffmannii]